MAAQAGLAGIVAVNDRYFPDDDRSAAEVGATSFALASARCLHDAYLLGGVLLYRRDDSITRPVTEVGHRAGLRSAVVRFNFGMPTAAVKAAFAMAVEQLVGARATEPPMIYYHTDSILPMHPDGLPSCLTHHAPSVSDFTRHFSANEASLAFGGPERTEHFRRRQEAGVIWLRGRPDAFVLHHSHLQRRWLVSQGVDTARMWGLRPPMQVPAGTSGPIDRLVRFASASDTLLLSAVARIDYFKNLELLVDAGVEILNVNEGVRVLIIGGSREQESTRMALLRRVPAALRARFLVVERLPKDQLYALFRRVRDRAYFVCPSRYETLGITPLEAAVCGVPTLVPDSELVEAARFFPPQNRFRPDLEGLVDVLTRLVGYQSRPEELRPQGLRYQLSTDLFRRDLLAAWQGISQIVRRIERVPAPVVVDDDLSTSALSGSLKGVSDGT
jgi:glycosyltransferase involved in cell wall biosynthesis